MDAKIHGRQSAGADAVRIRGLCDVAVALAGRKPCDQMQPLVGRGEVQPAARLLLQNSHQRVAPGLCPSPHAAQMGREMAFVQQRGERRFGEDGRIAVGPGAGFHDFFQQRLGRHQIAGAQARKEDLGKGADIGDAAGAIHALERGERRAAIAEFAVVIVLDDPGLVALGPVEQRQAAAHGHGHAQRKLMRGRDINRPRLGRAPLAILRVEAFLVDLYADHPRAAAFERRQRHGIAGILDPHRVAGPERGAQEKIEALLRPRGDDDLPRLAAHAARRTQIGGDGFAQGMAAARIAIAEKIRRRPGKCLAQQRRKMPVGARIKAGDADGQGQGGRWRRDRARGGGAPSGGRRGTWAATKVPAPTRASANPSRHQHFEGGNRGGARQAKRPARSRVVGSLAPAGTAPVSIRRRIAE